MQEYLASEDTVFNTAKQYSIRLGTSSHSVNEVYLSSTRTRNADRGLIASCHHSGSA